MAKRWVNGGVWVGLMASAMLVCGRTTAAQQPAAPGIVQQVTFRGVKHIKEEELRSLIGVKVGMPLNPRLNREGCQKILYKYEELGRSFAHCTLVKGGNLADTEVVYAVTEGSVLPEAPGVCKVLHEVKEKPPGLVGHMVIVGNGANIENASPLRTVISTPPSKTDTPVPPRVGQVRIVGNKRISDGSILAHVPVFPGQVLSYPDLQQAEKNLANLGLFVVDAAKGVRPTITVEGEGVFKDLVITVQEKPKAKRKSVKPHD